MELYPFGMFLSQKSCGWRTKKVRAYVPPGSLAVFPKRRRGQRLGCGCPPENQPQPRSSVRIFSYKHDQVENLARFARADQPRCGSQRNAFPFMRQPQTFLIP